VRVLTQYVWRDEPVDRGVLGPRAYVKWQSGLLFANGAPKPALAQYPAPIWIDAARRRVWGMVRPGAAAAVGLQRRPLGATAWQSVVRLTTGLDGAFLVGLPDTRPADYRYFALARVGGRDVLEQSTARRYRPPPAPRAVRRARSAGR
jgi:hypothetical protein